MSPHDRGVVGAAARWQGKEAAEHIKQKLLQGEDPSSDGTAAAGNREYCSSHPPCQISLCFR